MMKAAFAFAIAALAPPTLASIARADALPFASHRAAYSVKLAPGSQASNGNEQGALSATGLIGYEFRGSECEGYVSNFRQVTQLERAEGGPLALETRSMVFEDGQAKTIKFQIDATNGDKADPPIAGSATRGANGETTVDLSKPTQEKANIGADILFPTQHLQHIVEAAKGGAGSLHARVFDGSDTGKKVFDTLTVVGKESVEAVPEAGGAEALAKVRRWPVTISYFDEAKKDAPPEYTMSFALFENGVTGNMKLDYGSFALQGDLTKLELLPTPACGK